MKRFMMLCCTLACVLTATGVLAQGNPTGTVSGRVTGRTAPRCPA